MARYRSRKWGEGQFRMPLSHKIGSLERKKAKQIEKDQMEGKKKQGIPEVKGVR
jgi:hypothetical protein